MKKGNMGRSELTVGRVANSWDEEWTNDGQFILVSFSAMPVWAKLNDETDLYPRQPQPDQESQPLGKPEVDVSGWANPAPVLTKHAMLQAECRYPDWLRIQRVTDTLEGVVSRIIQPAPEQPEPETTPADTIRMEAATLRRSIVSAIRQYEKRTGMRVTCIGMTRKETDRKTDLM